MNGIEVVRRGLARETVITVKHWPSRELQPCVCTPNMSTMVVIDPSLWTPGDLAAHAKRLGGGIAGGLPGAAKGRILYATNFYLPARWEAVGMAFLHVPRRRNKPLQVTRLAFATNMPDDERRIVRGLLLRCAKRVAEASGRANGRLQLLADESDVGAICRDHGFHPVGRNRQQRILELR
jgi:hypothetical protein